jgi:hypothetical protein
VSAFKVFGFLFCCLVYSPISLSQHNAAVTGIFIYPHRQKTTIQTFFSNQKIISTTPLPSQQQQIMSPPLEYKDIINALEGKDGAYWQKMLMELTQKNKAATPSDVHEAVVHAKRLPLDLSTVIPDSQCIHLDEKFLAEYRSKHPEFRYGALGEVTYKRTYARTVNWITRKKENWFDTVKRVVEGTLYIQ